MMTQINKTKVIFVGVQTIGWHCVKALLESKANVKGIFTVEKQKIVETSSMHPDYFGDFEEFTSKHGIPLSILDNVNDINVPLNVKRIREMQPDFVFCIGWPGILKRELLEIPSKGCIGLHPTLLPERRGGAPINWCIIDGLSRSAVTLLYLDEGLDSGDIIVQREFEIALEDTAKTILQKITNVAVQLMKEHYPLLVEGKAPRKLQDHSKATYTRRRRPEDGFIDWKRTSFSIYNWIRALTLPFPGAFTYWKGKKVLIWESELPKGYKPRFKVQPGEVLDILNQKGIIVATADSCVLIKDVNIDGKNVKADEFAHEYKLERGNILGGLQ